MVGRRANLSATRMGVFLVVLGGVAVIAVWPLIAKPNQPVELPDLPGKGAFLVSNLVDETAPEHGLGFTWLGYQEEYFSMTATTMLGESPGYVGCEAEYDVVMRLLAACFDGSGNVRPVAQPIYDALTMSRAPHTGERLEQPPEGKATDVLALWSLDESSRPVHSEDYSSVKQSLKELAEHGPDELRPYARLTEALLCTKSEGYGVRLKRMRALRYDSTLPEHVRYMAVVNELMALEGNEFAEQPEAFKEAWSPERWIAEERRLQKEFPGMRYWGWYRLGEVYIRKEGQYP